MKTYKARAIINPITYMGLGAVALVMIAVKTANINNSYTEFIIPVTFGMFAASLLTLFTQYHFDGNTLLVKSLFSKQEIKVEDVPKIEYKRINLFGQMISGAPKAVLIVYYTKFDSIQVLLPLSHPLVKAVETSIKEKDGKESSELA